MKKLIVCLIFFFALSACDNESTTPQSLLAMQIQTTGTGSGIDTIEKQPYKLYGLYADHGFNIFKISNNYLPKFYKGFEIYYLALLFNTEIKQLDLHISEGPIISTISEMDFNLVIINLIEVKSDNFRVWGTVTDIDGNIIIIRTPTITYR